MVLSGATQDALVRKDDVRAPGEFALRGREGSIRIYTIDSGTEV